MPLTKDEVYDIWRYKASPWTPWVKPVLFSFLGNAELSASHDMPLRTWEAPIEEATAIIADMPGVEGVWAGLALAQAGYRPIPVYNACPFATYASDAPYRLSFPAASQAPTAVDVVSILRAISHSANALGKCALPDDAPPVFLVDKNRKGHGRPDYGWFDNRSFVSLSDFPSADVLKQHRIRNVVLVGTDRKVAHDLLTCSHYLTGCWHSDS